MNLVESLVWTFSWLAVETYLVYSLRGLSAPNRELQCCWNSMLFQKEWHWRKVKKTIFFPRLRVRIKDNNNSPHGKFLRFLYPFSSKFPDLNFVRYLLYIYLCVTHTVSLDYLCFYTGKRHRYNEWKFKVQSGECSVQSAEWPVRSGPNGNRTSKYSCYVRKMLETVTSSIVRVTLNSNKFWWVTQYLVGQPGKESAYASVGPKQRNRKWSGTVKAPCFFVVVVWKARWKLKIVTVQ